MALIRNGKVCLALLMVLMLRLCGKHTASRPRFGRRWPISIPLCRSARRKPRCLSGWSARAIRARTTLEQLPAVYGNRRTAAIVGHLIFDKQPVAAIGALAVAPTDPSVVWAGTGEAWVIRDSDVIGNGIYKSTDAGKTWTNMGLQETGRIGRIIVHPANPDIVFACALGRATGPQQERGVFRTVDGGQHWERVLFAGENVGCSGLSMDPHNPRVLFAGMWQLEMHT